MGVAGAGAVAAAAATAVVLATGAAAAPAPGVPGPAPGVPVPAASIVAAPLGPVVALGDSYTAGDILPLSLTSQPPGCLRSSDSYPVQVAKALGATLVDAACGSAGVKEMTQAQQTYLGTNAPQLTALAPDDRVVMLTLSGDDMGFMNVLDECMALSITDLWGSPCESHYASGGTDQLAARVTAEAPRLTAVLQAIHARAPSARVLLVGYPDMFPQQGGCWPGVPITDGDIAYLRGVEGQLNSMLVQVAAATGATYVDTYTPTIGHDFCQDAGVRDVEGLVPSSFTVPFHPNARGQAAMAAAVLAALGV
ncbi:MAG TPA: SGNH/GDSL hydrolase family protein [Trebonia sp.]|nr:SGNH/GDSL hydrolase family protein [Trebonia sp.]